MVKQNREKPTSDRYWFPNLGPSSGSIKASNPPLSITAMKLSSSNCTIQNKRSGKKKESQIEQQNQKSGRGRDLHGGDVHDAPAHERAVADVAAEHVGDDDLGEVDIRDGSVAGVVEVFGEAGVATSGDEEGEGERVCEGTEEGKERVSEVGPLCVPLEGIGAEGEELVPVLFASEVSEGFKNILRC